MTHDTRPIIKAYEVQHGDWRVSCPVCDGVVIFTNTWRNARHMARDHNKENHHDELIVDDQTDRNILKPWHRQMVGID